ncbi:MAG: [protein-PII] uridylyltransferase [Nitratireductor sp.]
MAKVPLKLGEIINGASLRARLSACASEAGGDGSGQAVRAAVLKALREELAAGRTKAEAMLMKDGGGTACAARLSHLMDEIIRALHGFAVSHVYASKNPSAAEKMAIVAVGGYGRGTLAPGSDIDLLFLLPYKQTPWGEQVTEYVLYMLWDMGLKVGHATRNVDECVRLSRTDMTIRTAVLEARFLCGESPLFDELLHRFDTELMRRSGGEFVQAKLAERDARHAKAGESRYLVEPNVKDGKGGLRDLHTLFWIGKYYYRVRSGEELVERGVFTRKEYLVFRKAEDFLWAVRCHMHFHAGKAEERLHFDIQRDIADRLGYTSHPGLSAVERFMKHYFLVAKDVGDLTRILCAALEEEQARHVPGFNRLVQSFSRRRRKVPGTTDFIIDNDRINVADPQAFERDPVNMLRLFWFADRHGLEYHPEALKLLRRSLKLIDRNLRRDAEANRLFLDVLTSDRNPELNLRRMNEAGVLSKLIPDFGKIVAMMQFNMYHSYTVDEHTIQCIANLARIEKGELEEELPVASSILKRGVNRKVLYVALLLHDIGKGRPEDHSIIGAKLARRIGPRLGLKRDEVDTVEWLVRYHLLMSDMAQKRDIADPRTVRDFAKAVQTVKRLDLLCVLTVCDIRGVGPNTWNNWKAVLIRALYRQTERALETGLEDLNRENRGAEAKKALRAALSDWPRKLLQQETARHYPPYWQGLHVTAHVAFAELLRDIGNDDIRIDLHPDEDRGATRASFVMADHPGIFARLAGALALVGANVVDARSYTTKDGFVTDAFWIQDSEGNAYEASRLPRLRDTIEKTLRGEIVARDALKSRDKVKKRERAFKVPTHITFDNEGSEIYTIIEVDTRDRPGLLYDLTRTLAGSNVYIANAVIATFGEQVVDTFYVKDMFGLKYYTEAKQRTLEKRLREAIAAGVERAEG